MIYLVAFQENSPGDGLQIASHPIFLLACLITLLGLFIVLVMIARRGRDRLDNQENIYRQQFDKKKLKIEDLDGEKEKKQNKFE